MTETAEHIAELRHQCALNGPCSDYTDGCGCTDSQLVVRAFRKNLAEVKAAMTETVSDDQLRDMLDQIPRYLDGNPRSGWVARVDALIRELLALRTPAQTETVSDERLLEWRGTPGGAFEAIPTGWTDGYFVAQQITGATWVASDPENETLAVGVSLDEAKEAAQIDYNARRTPPQNTDGEAGLVERAVVQMYRYGIDDGGSPALMRSAVTAALAEAASLLSTLKAELDHLTKSGIIEVSIRNPSVADYMRHWEGRAEAAEAERDALAKQVNQYAWERDNARAERDHAERRSEEYWRLQVQDLKSQVATLKGDAP